MKAYLIYSQIMTRLETIIPTISTSAAINGDTWPHPLIILIIVIGTVISLAVVFFIVLVALYYLFNWLEQNWISKGDRRTNSDLVKEGK
ncbi:MAG: hypothetical protein JSV04_15530 [Candidatus Heimdallarchaeota archaeon]|nr:MAG: hypothetical protein JSV04_15530 [Candidatus Heimdallarchaeota archaeon]